MPWRGTLFEKELRQNAGIPVFLCVWLAVMYLVVWWRPYIYVDASETEMGSATFLLSGMLFLLAGSLGSAFLTEETATHTVNFLFRLPVARKRIFIIKIESHMVLLLLGFLVALFLRWGFLECVLPRSVAAREGSVTPWGFLKGFGTWVGDLLRGEAFDPLELIPFPILLIYFLATLWSLLLNRALVAFVAALVTFVLLVELITVPTMALTHLVRERGMACMLATSIVPTAALLFLIVASWRAFSRIGDVDDNNKAVEEGGDL